VARASSTNAIQRIIGDRLTKARDVTGKTQEQAASDAGIDYKRWQRLEGGAVNATIRTLTRAAEAVGISFWELCAGDVVSPPARRRARKS
jgi:transcriptional regulator with XRE-family HTH domain